MPSSSKSANALRMSSFESFSLYTVQSGRQSAACIEPQASASKHVRVIFSTIAHQAGYATSDTWPGSSYSESHTIFCVISCTNSL